MFMFRAATCRLCFSFLEQQKKVSNSTKLHPIWQGNVSQIPIKIESAGYVNWEKYSYCPYNEE